MSIARLYTPTSLHLDPICKGIDRGRVAQLEEHRPYKPGVTGSSPVPPTIYLINSIALDCFLCRKSVEHKVLIFADLLKVKLL